MESIVIRLNPIDRLELLVNASRWTQVWLVVNSHKIFLGAEDCSIIVSRLAKLSGDISLSEAHDIIDGILVIWVMSLSELHSSLYIGKTTSGDTALFVQNGDGKIIAHLALDIEMLEQEIGRIM